MHLIETMLQRDFSDPINLVPFLMVLAIVLYFIAIFLDQPPE